MSKQFALLLAVVIIVEALVEYVSTIADMVTSKQYKKAIKQGGAIAVCMSLCFQAHLDMFALCGITFTTPWLGTALTGIFGSRGSNYIADLLKKLTDAGTAFSFDDIFDSGTDKYSPFPTPQANPAGEPAAAASYEIADDGSGASALLAPNGVHGEG